MEDPSAWKIRAASRPRLYVRRQTGGPLALLAVCVTALFFSLGETNSRADQRWCERLLTPCYPDNFEHTFCWGPGFDRQNLREAARYAMSNLARQTRFTKNFVGDCTTTTDIVWRELSKAGEAGEYACVTANVAGECEKARVRINPETINSYSHAELNRDVTSCHEVGHSGSADHGEQKPGCMKSGHVIEGHRHYSDHHVNHLNRRY